MFDARFARRRADRYRRKGLDATAQRLVDVLAAPGVEGAAVLEIGGGAGEIGLELLRRGATSATNLELSPAYDVAASALITEAGMTGRVHRRLVDIATDPLAVEPADIVVLHRVVCCYPDVDALVGAAASLTRRRLVLTYPQQRGWIGAGLAMVNAYLRLRRCGFRTYLHPVTRIAGTAEQHGLTLERRVKHGLLWESASLARS